MNSIFVQFFANELGGLILSDSRGQQQVRFLLQAKRRESPASGSQKASEQDSKQVLRAVCDRPLPVLGLCTQPVTLPSASHRDRADVHL